MIRVDIIRQSSPGVWEYGVTTPVGSARGFSGQPLLDACRDLQQMGEDPDAMAGMYWPGEEAWAMRCPIRVGAGLTVCEDKKGSRFRKWRPSEYSKAAE